MTEIITSNFHVDTAIVSGDVPVAPHNPGSSNIFPKYLHGINQTSWELWYFEGFTEDRAAIVVGVDRSAFYRDRGGWRVQVIAVWPDRTRWHHDLAFPESIITGTGDSGDISGLWRNSTEGSSIAFDISGHATKAVLTFNVPGFVTGTVNLTSHPGDKGLDTSPCLGSKVFYLRPIGRAAVAADLAFKFPESEAPRKLSILNANGGMDRFWGGVPWTGLMSESYFLRAYVGPYAIQVMRILSTTATGKQPSTIARLYHDNKLVCTAQNSIGPEAQQVSEDSLSVVKDYSNSDDNAAIVGDFSDKNSGYGLIFVEAGQNGRRWSFRVRHNRKAWSIPTSAPGPGATGNNGFMETVTGGLEGETFEGVGVGGQIMLK